MAANFYASVDSTEPDTQIDLQWQTVSNSMYYDIMRDGVLINTADVQADLDCASYIDSNLQPHTTYSYTLVCRQSDGTIVDMNYQTITTGAIYSPVISNSVYNINTGLTTIYFSKCSNAMASNNVTRLEYASTITMVTDTVSECSFYDSDTNLNVQRIYVVCTKSANGQMSTNSNYTTVTPIGVPIIQATYVSRIVTLTWSLAYEVSYFYVERSTYNGSSWGDWVEDSSENLPNNSTQFQEQLTEGGSYRYRLQIYNPNYTGVSNISNGVFVPLAPVDLTANWSDPNTISLSWTTNILNNCQLSLEKKKTLDPNIDNQPSYSQIAILDPNTTSYSDSNDIDPNFIYFYRLTAFNNDVIDPNILEISISTKLPDSPTNLELYIVSPSKINLLWTNNSDNEAGFIIARQTDSQGYTQIAVVPENTTVYSDSNVSSSNQYSYSDPNVNSSDQYSYMVCAYNYAGNSPEYSNEVYGLLDDYIAPPNTFDANAVSDTEIDLNFTYAANLPYGTVIERKTGVDGIWTEIARLNGDLKAYSDTGLDPNTNYFYRIKGIIGIDTYTDMVPSISGASVLTYLRNPTGLTGEYISSSQIQLNWPGSPDILYYIIARSLDGSIFTSEALVAEDANLMWIDTDIQPQTTYYYKVKAESLGNSSDYSDELTMNAPTVDNPTGLDYSIINSNQVKLTWNENSDNENGFIVERKEQDGNEWVAFDALDPNTTSFIDANVVTGNSYYYRVEAFLTGLDINSYSDELGVTVQEIKAPSNLTVEVLSPIELQLSWEVNSDNEDGFVIEKKVRDSNYTEVSTTDAGATSYTDSNLDSATTYVYRIYAFNSLGQSSYSNECEATTANSIIFEDLASADDESKICGYIFC